MIDIAVRYGVNETNPLIAPTDYSQFAEDWYTVSRLVEEGGRFSRIRLLTERGYPYMDISYIHGVLSSGQPVHININFDGHMLLRKTYRSQLQESLIREGLTKAQVNALGVWKSETYSILYG